MLSVHDYLAIRVAHEKQESKRSIARRLHHSQQTVAKVIASPTGVPVPYRRCKPAEYPKLGAFIARIDAILIEDGSAPVKQRHTAMQLYRRLVSEEGYQGKYDQVRRYVNKYRRERRETILPLCHLPGERMECDFGEISVDYPDGRRLKDVLIVTWSFSHAIFMIATPNQRTESVLHGMVAALEFFGCVAREVWWDNPKTIATVVLRGRERKLNDDYAALASHYRFDPRACMPRKGQEKPDAESGVKACQRRACTPVPKVKDDEQLNAHLLSFCQAEMNRTVRGENETIGERFEKERLRAIGLPAHRFDPCISASVLIDKYQTAMFEHNRYSVPKWAAFLSATVKGYVDRVQILQDGRVIAVHGRSYARGEWIVEPLHYVAALSVRPHALDHSRVFKDFVLPPIFNELRQRFEREHGVNAGIRQYVRVLQLLVHHRARCIAQAISLLWHRLHLRSEQIEEKAEELARQDPNGVESSIASSLPGNNSSARQKTLEPPARQGKAPGAECTIPGADCDAIGAIKNAATTGATTNITTALTTGAARDSPCLPLVQVPRPDLRIFNQLLSFCQNSNQGVSNHESPESQPSSAAAAHAQGAQAAHHAGGA